jgi:hypothetical protein
MNPDPGAVMPPMGASKSIRPRLWRGVLRALSVGVAAVLFAPAGWT